MYNEAVKQRYLQEMQFTETSRKWYISIFNTIEPYETAWQADLCTRTAEELRPVMDDVAGIVYSTKAKRMSALRAYVRWCLKSGIPGACSGFLELQTETDSTEKIRSRMVQSPLQLQRFLNLIFEPEDEETIDIIYRCYLWCGFFGIEENCLMDIRISDVTMDPKTKTGEIRVGDDVYDICREAYRTFWLASSLKSFSYTHPLYGAIRRDRKELDKLFIGYKGVMTLKTFRNGTFFAESAALKEGKTDMRPSYLSVKLSGLFYRMYVRECLGFDADFDRVASEIIEKKQHTPNATAESLRAQRLAKANHLKKDYLNWKKAFLL